jgi:hypothetical protein
MSGTPTGRLARYIVRLYPRAWRTRYAAEALDLLELRAPTWSDLGNLAYHVLYTWLHPDLLADGEGVAARGLAGLIRALWSREIAIFWAVVAAMVAWLQFGGLVDGGPYLPLVGSAGTWPFFGIRPANGISAALAAQSAAVDLACAATLAGGVPLMVAAWRRSPSVRRYVVVLLVTVVGAVAPVPVLAALIRGPAERINLTFATPITDAYCAWFVGLAVVSALALSRIVTDGKLGDGLLRYAFVPGLVATVALLLLLGATVAWGIAAHAEVPALFDRGDLAHGSATAVSWLLDVLVMAGAAGIALMATIRGASGGVMAARRTE